MAIVCTRRTATQTTGGTSAMTPTSITEASTNAKQPDSNNNDTIKTMFGWKQNHYPSTATAATTTHLQ
jgi:hypothetical protein